MPASTNKFSVNELAAIARCIRRHIVVMNGTTDTSHSGSALSAVEILTTLYFGGVMRVDPKRPRWPNRDRFILSKGHASTVLYAALAERGYFPSSRLTSFVANGSRLAGHPGYWCVPGVEAETGSLGHGLAVGIGMALAARQEKRSSRVYVLVSDGECNEGSTWESVLFAGHHKLDNLTVFVDYNKIQSFGRTAEVLQLEPFTEKFRSFRWHVQEIDGHDFSAIFKATRTAQKVRGKPQCIIAHTVKGKGISFMEDKLEWHYRAPIGELLSQALKELDDKKTELA